MEQLLLRQSHEVALELHEASSAKLHESLLYFLVPYLFLLIMAFIYLRQTTFGSYALPFIPDDRQQLFFFVIVIALLGGVGIYVAANHRWDSSSWLMYAIISILLALFIFAYQSGKGVSLGVSCIVMVGAAFVCYWLFFKLAHSPAQEERGHGYSLNLIGAVQAFTIVWAIMVTMQVLIFQCGLDRKIGTIVFYLVTVVALVMICFSHVHHHKRWHDMYGYIAMGGALLIVILFRIYNTY